MSAQRVTRLPGYSATTALYRSRHKRGYRRRFKYVRRFKRRVEKALESTVLEQAQYIVSSSNVITSGSRGNGTGIGVVNQQGQAIPLVILSYADLNGIMGKIGTSVGGVPALTSKVQKFIINNVNVRMMFKNQSNISVIADLYELAPRVDTTSTPLTLWQTGMSDQNSVNADLVPGVTPFQSNLLCSIFKIMSKTRYLLSPGAVEVCEIRRRRPITINNERIQQLSSTGASTYKGISRTFMLCIQGEPADDATTNTFVQAGQAKISWTTTEIYDYSYAINNTVKTDTVDSTSGVLAQAKTTLVDTGATGITVAAS